MKVAAQVTVLMAVRDGAAFVEEAVRSILAQTWADFSLVIVDDGSRDRTAGILMRLAGEDARVRILTNASSLGLAASLNRGLEMAEGDYIVRMDADDVALPERIAVQVAFMNAHPRVVAAGCWAERFGDASGLIAPRMSHRRIAAMLAFGNPLVHPGMIIRREVLVRDSLRYPDYATAQDYALWTRLAGVGELAIIPRVLLRYRVHGDSISARKGGERRRIVREIQQGYLARVLGFVPEAAVLERHARLAGGEAMGWLDLFRLGGWLVRLVWLWPARLTMPAVVMRRVASYAVGRLRARCA